MNAEAFELPTEVGQSVVMERRSQKGNVTFVMLEEDRWSVTYGDNEEHTHTLVRESRDNFHLVNTGPFVALGVNNSDLGFILDNL